MNLPPLSTLTGIVFGGACIVVGLIRDELSLLTFGGGLLGFSGLIPNAPSATPATPSDTVDSPHDDNTDTNT